MISANQAYSDDVFNSNNVFEKIDISTLDKTTIRLYIQAKKSINTFFKVNINNQHQSNQWQQNSLNAEAVAQESSLKRCCQKFLKIHRGNPVPESIFW